MRENRLAVALESPDGWPHLAPSRYHCFVVFDASAPPQGASGEARRPLLGELLIQAKVVTAEQLAAGARRAGEPVNDKKIGQLLIERGWITEAQLTQTLSLQLSVPWVSLYHIDFSRQLLNRVRARARRALLPHPDLRAPREGAGRDALRRDGRSDERGGARRRSSRQANLPARPMIASATDIRSAIRVYYGEPAGPDRSSTCRRRRRGSSRAASTPMTTRGGGPSDAPRRDGAVAAATRPDASAARCCPRRVVRRLLLLRRRPCTDDDEPPPPTTRSNPPPGGRPAAALAAEATGAEPAPSNRTSPCRRVAARVARRDVVR